VATRADPTLGYATDIGRGSEFNQDKLGFYRPDDPRLMDLAGSIYVVADGMGTRERGTALADLAIRAVVRAYYAAVRDHGRGEALAVAVSAADRALRQSLAENPDPGDAGVSLAAAVVRGEELIVGHVGDCRAYLVRDGRAYRLADDAGVATYLGRGSAPEPTVSDRIAIGPGDRLLLCTDGLHQLVTDDQIGPVVAGATAQEASDRLIAQANARGGWDNITAVVVAPFATATVAPRPVAAPPTAVASEIPWRTVAVVVAPILIVAALAFLVPWGALLDQWRASAVARGNPAPTVFPAITVVAEATEGPTVPPTPTELPTPTVPVVVLLTDLTGETVENARQYARTNGLVLEEIKQFSANVRPGFVISQSPKRGAQTKAGDTVQVAISLGPPPAASRTPVRRPLFRPTAAPSATAVLAAPTVMASPTSAPSGGGQEKPKPEPPQPTQPPPPPPTEKPQPPTPKPDLPTPGPQPSEEPLAPLTGPSAGAHRVRGLAAPLPATRAPATEPSPWDRLARALAALARWWHDMVGGPAAVPSAAPVAFVQAPAQASGTPTSALTPTATITSTGTITVTATITPTVTLTPTATDTPTPTPTPTDTPTPTPTATNTPTPTPTPTFTPAPAYLPKVLRGQWLLCTEPWRGIDDPEPNDSPPTAVLLCDREWYTGRLYRSTGPPDLQDYYVILMKARGTLRVNLDVPSTTDDYDVGVYDLQAGTYRLLLRSTGTAGQDEEVVLTGLAPGRYWLQIWGQGRQIEAPYRLKWEAK
jgi:serine/threonine protein phosphatase PrpC